MPVLDEWLVGELGLFGELGFFQGPLSDRGGAFGVLGAVAGWCVGAEFQCAEFAVDDGLAFERVVLFGGEQLPAEAREFAGGRDDRDLRATADFDALVEGAERPGVLIADQAASPRTCRQLEEPCLEIRPWRAGLWPDCRTRGSMPR